MANKDTKMKDFDIVHIPIMDATTGNTDIQTIASDLFDKQFDLKKLEDAWYELVNVWPFLASRIRLCKEAPSGLAYHIPKQSQLKLEDEANLPAKKRQFYAWDLSHLSIKSYWPGGGSERLFGEHTSIPFVCNPPKKKEQEKVTSFNGVKSFKELLKSDRTTFTAQATTFNDATIITLSFAHVIGDGFCVKDILNAWSEVVRGNKPKPQPSLIPDNYSSIGMENNEKLPLRFKLLGLSEKMKLIRNILYDYQIRRPEREMQLKYIHFPGEYIANLQKEANEYLEEKFAEKVIPFKISRSDITLAILVQNYAASLKTSNTLTPVTIANARGKKVEGIEFDFSHVLGGCAICLPLKGISVKELKKMSIGELAFQIHKDIQEQIDPINLRNLFALALFHYSWKRVYGSDKVKAKSQIKGKMPFFGSTESRFVGLTDWRALQFNKVNFQGAIISKNGEKENDEPCYIKSINARMITPFSHRDRFACLGDLDGSLWISGTLSKKEWKNPKGFGQYKHL